MNKRDTVVTTKQEQAPGKRGRKPDERKIAKAVKSQWNRIDMQIKSRLAASLPDRVSDAKHHVLKTAAETIALATVKVRGNRK